LNLWNVDTNKRPTKFQIGKRNELSRNVGFWVWIRRVSTVQNPPIMHHASIDFFFLGFQFIYDVGHFYVPAPLLWANE